MDTDNNNTHADAAQHKELTVCDIMGEWGPYQWSVSLFAAMYSAIFVITVVMGPILTPDMSHVCAPSNYTQSGYALHPAHLEQLALNFTNKPHECTRSDALSANSDGAPAEQVLKCETFIYDDSVLGKTITNSFDLVCDREWQRSFLSSSALAGMLLSSSSMGVLSDKYGRMACVEGGIALSILATLGAVLSNDYWLLNACVLAMSFAQVGVANALCTLVMEATSPKYRFAPVFEYGMGWGLGIMLVPLFNNLTRNYTRFLLFSLIWQLLLLPWLRWGVFESIRWLLSEGLINRAQIELQRACRINRVKNGAKLAQEIAKIQAQQVRKASRIIEEDVAAARLARALDRRVDTTAHELDMLSTAIRCSFGLSDDLPNITERLARDARKASTLELSPTLKRLSFSLDTPTAEAPDDGPNKQQVRMHLVESEEPTRNIVDDNLSTIAKNFQLTSNDANSNGPKYSLTTQGLIHLAMRYSKAVQQEEEGRFFLAQMFHRKLWRPTVLLTLLSIMLETSYYGFVQANKFVGDDVNLNYLTGALGEYLGAVGFMIVLWAFSRPSAIILPTIVGSLACLGMALSYHFLPDPADSLPSRPASTLITDSMIKYDQVDSAIIITDPINVTSSTTHAPSGFLSQSVMENPVELREQINFWLMNIGRLAVTIGVQVACTIAMETYPNNLRQTGPGVILLMGRVGSICAPFLYNDTTEDRIVIKLTLIVLASIGFVVCILTPFFMANKKDKELCDHLYDIEET